jgi:hypothetical protein
MRESMEIYPRTAAERAMKLQEVLLRATAGKMKWWQAAELMGISVACLTNWHISDHGIWGRFRKRTISYLYTPR